MISQNLEGQHSEEIDLFPRRSVHAFVLANYFALCQLCQHKIAAVIVLISENSLTLAQH